MLPRRLDHVNFLASEIAPHDRFMAEILGGRKSEQIMLDDGSLAAIWYTMTDKSYDLVYTNDWTKSPWRNHE